MARWMCLMLVIIALSASDVVAQSGSGDGSGSDAPTTSEGTEGVGTSDNDKATAEFYEQTWFIGACAGLGAVVLLGTGAVIYLDRRRVHARRQRQHAKNKKHEGKVADNNNRRKSVLEELMGYDPMPQNHIGELSENDMNMWVASNQQLRLPHVAVEGVHAVPFSSHGVVAKSKSQISMNAQMFVKDWGEEVSHFPNMEHSNVVLNPLFEEPLTDHPGMQRRPSQLSMMRRALATTDEPVGDGIEWTIDAD